MKDYPSVQHYASLTIYMLSHIIYLSANNESYATITQ